MILVWLVLGLAAWLALNGAVFLFLSIARTAPSASRVR